ncbi:MAG: peptidoglycan DD-metalloendopeptidase family protein [Alphaproteobacteria bacterium]|jgi:murein DD-endopeptidase MepM/ murein hydrolase activator NlpD|nr:peptidoglycan DD-metalloendopeptidase family protein [Alphaproteobacteria bacterium]
MEDSEVGLLGRLGARVAYFFRDREIILRSDGQIRYFTFSRHLQIGLVCTWCLLTGWVGFATGGYLNQLSLIDAKNQAIWRSQASYRELLDQVSDYQLSIVSITRDLKETQSNLRRLFDQNETLKHTLYSTETELKLTQVERDRITTGRHALRDQFELLGKEVRRMTSKNNALESHIGNLRGHLESVQAEKAEIAAERRAMGDRLWRLSNDLQGTIMRSEQLETTIQSLRSDLRNAMISKGSIGAENDSLRARVVSLETSLDEEAAQHREQLEAISERALKNIHALEAVLIHTGLNLKNIAPLPKGTIMGQGGPFVPYHPDMRPTEDVESLEQDLETNIDRWGQLRDVVATMPLIAPIEGGYVSSRFGRRKDPISKRWAMHKGLDLGGRYKTPVRATAPGTVIFAGRRAYYGRTIDVQHENGLMTRYAHLYRIKVKRGQKVNLADEIGLLGSSGRSTGPHVHYEIRHLGKALDPRKFLRATKNVQQ